MKILSKITPAETILIKGSIYAELKDLMKYTFMDLLLKKVIEINKVSKKSHPKDKYVRTYTYIVSGKSFNKYKPKNHELIYLSPFIKSRSIRILLRNYIKMAYDTSNGSSNYKSLVKSNREINYYFKQSFFLTLFRLDLLTSNGTKLKKEISNYLNNIDKSISHLLLHDKKKALKILLGIGGNIFLLKNLDFRLLKTIDKQLLNQEKALYNETYDSDSDWQLYFDFFEDNYMFDSYFDDTFDSFDSEFDAASCSSCDSSGCSSCGGCGGD